MQSHMLQPPFRILQRPPLRRKRSDHSQECIRLTALQINKCVSDPWNRHQHRHVNRLINPLNFLHLKEPENSEKDSDSVEKLPKKTKTTQKLQKVKTEEKDKNNEKNEDNYSKNKIHCPTTSLTEQLKDKSLYEAIEFFMQKNQSLMSANSKTTKAHKTLIDSKEVTNITIQPLAIYLITIFFFGPSDKTDFQSTIAYGAKVAFVCFVILGTVILPTGPFIRPHPIVWNLFFSVSIVYFFFLIFLSYQSTENARRFFLGHFLGWAAKSLLVRNRLICWTLSVFWEMLEYSLIFFFPNFAECWWDSLLLDILICNALGIEFGLALCNLLEMKEYHWSGVLELKGCGRKLRRVALQFSPESWMRVRWEPLSTIKRFVAANVLALMLLLVDINSFTLKAALLIPSESYINVTRLVMCGLGMPAIRQYYIYVTDPACERMGSMTITSVLILIAELALSIKLTAGEVQAVPRFSLQLWAAYAALYFAACAALVLKVKKERKE